MAEISRRTLLSRGLILAAAVGGTALGVTRSVHHKIAVPPPPPPAALTALLSRQQVLLSGYDRAIAANGTAAAFLGPLRAEVSAHSDAVRALLQHYPGWRLAPAVDTAAATSSAPATTAATATAELKSAVTSAQAAFASGCLAWPESEQYAGQVVPILGVIAASLATQLAVLS